MDKFKNASFILGDLSESELVTFFCFLNNNNNSLVPIKEIVKYVRVDIIVHAILFIFRTG